MDLTCNLCGKVIASDISEGDIGEITSVICKACKAKKDEPKPIIYLAEILHKDVTEQQYSETNYEQLVQRIVDAIRKRQHKLPLRIVIRLRHPKQSLT